MLALGVGEGRGTSPAALSAPESKAATSGCGSNASRGAAGGLGGGAPIDTGSSRASATGTTAKTTA